MSDIADVPRVVFAHGKESGPWGSKISQLARIAETLGFAVESLDYQNMDEAGQRLAHLIDHAPTGAPLVLVGSSMGGYVSAMASAALSPDAMLLMAPALYMDDYPGDPGHCPLDTVVVHGWNDEIVPVAHSIDFARERYAELHVVADDHRLGQSIDFIGRVFAAQLQRALAYSTID